MKGNIEDYINYRLEKAKETFADAKLLAKNNSWNSCVNRLYYSCFYCVNALLIKNNMAAKTHNRVRTIFFREFLQNGKIDKDFGKLYSDLFDW